METSEETEQGWFRTAQRCVALLIFGLTLALWAHAEAATPQYTFSIFELPFPNMTGFFLTGVDANVKSPHMVGWYTDIHSNGTLHGWRGTRSAGFTSVPRLAVTAINKSKWLAGYEIPPASARYQGFLYIGTEYIPISVPGCSDVTIQGISDVTMQGTTATAELVGDCLSEADGLYHPLHWRDGVATIVDVQIPDGQGGFLSFPNEGCGYTGIAPGNGMLRVGSCEGVGFFDAQGLFIPVARPDAYVLPKGVSNGSSVYGTLSPWDGSTGAGFIWKGIDLWQLVRVPGAVTTTIETMASERKFWGNAMDANGGWHAFTATR